MPSIKTFDANDQLFFERQLDYIKEKFFEVQYEDIIWQQMFPLNTEADPAAQRIVGRVYDMYGKAKIIHDFAKDFSTITLGGAEFNYPVKVIGDAFVYTMFDVMRARMAGVNLDVRAAIAKRRAIDELTNDIMFNGDAESNLPGLLSNTDVPAGNVGNGAGGTPEWDTKTPDEILYDINVAVGEIVTTTKGKMVPDTLGVPPAQYVYLYTTKVSAYSDLTIGDYLTAKQTFIKNIFNVPQFTSAGAGGGDIFCVYKRDPSVVEANIPQLIEFLPAQQTAMAFQTIAYQVISGLHIYHPKAFNIYEDI